MIDIDITEEIKAKAREQAAKIQSTNGTNPTTRYMGYKPGRQTYLGFLGQFCFAVLLKEHQIRFTHILDVNPDGRGDIGDFIIDNELYDTKSQGWGPGTPDPEWYVHVASHQISKIVDYYVWLFVNKRRGIARTCCWLPRSVFLQKMVLWKKGERRSKKLTVIEDMYVVQVKDTIKIEALLDLLKARGNPLEAFTAYPESKGRKRSKQNKEKENEI